MSTATVEEPRIVHALPGRVRVHVPGWTGANQHAIERRLRALPGTRSAQASPLTGNVLVCYDPARGTPEAILGALHGARAHEAEEADEPPPRAHLPHARREGQGEHARARISVRALESHPDLAAQIVRRLEHQPSVHARASLLTGRVLVEFDEHRADLDDLLATIAKMDLPDQPGTDNPADPLDPTPLVQSATRLVGASLGLGLIGARSVAGATSELPGAAVAGQMAGFIGILQSLPFVRNGLRRSLGRDIADLALQVPGIVTLTLSDSPLGLLVTLAESLRLFTEVVARRGAWRRMSERLGAATSDQPGELIRIETGDRVPLVASILEGSGTATNRDGMPLPVGPHSSVPAGARLYGGPFVARLEAGHGFTPEARPAPPSATVLERYIHALGPLTLGYTALTAVLTRSLARTLQAILLVNPRTALIGVDSAETGAMARMLRAGATIVGTRRDRSLRQPNMLLIDGPRVLSDGYELTSIIPLSERYDGQLVLARAGGISSATRHPWGGVFRGSGGGEATDGRFDEAVASASIQGTRYTLGPIPDGEALPAAERLRHRGDYVLRLTSDHEDQPIGLIGLRPRLAPGAGEVAKVCHALGIPVGICAIGDPIAGQAIAQRVGLPLLDQANPMAIVRSLQAGGAIVWCVSDSAESGEVFAACDLAIGITDGRTRFPARADLLVPDIGTVAAVVDASARRTSVVRGAVAISMLANLVGAALGVSGRGGNANAPLLSRAARAMNVGAFAALGLSWLRLRGGERAQAQRLSIADPHPESWGRQGVADVLRMLGSRPTGLTSAEATTRPYTPPTALSRRPIWRAILEQARSPIVLLLAAGAGLSFTIGAPADAAVILATVTANVAIGVWQERKADQVASALRRQGTARVNVIRDGTVISVPADVVVVGDVLDLAPGDRITADARVISARGLEVDEATLTGESLPVLKAPDAPADGSRVVLEGSDVTSGWGRAVVVATGRRTRMGAMMAALAQEESAQQSPLDRRLAQTLRQILPIAIGSGAIITASGYLQSGSLLPEIATGSSAALAAVPEGMPLLTRVSEAAVARRLAHDHALMRRLAAVEALGRVDVACVDKTGTLTQGRLELTLVATDAQEASLPGELPEPLRDVLLTAALGSPHPDSPELASHPTDQAVVHAAERAGMGAAARIPREAEAPFDPVRAFHAAVAHGRLCVKGAPEAVLPHCVRQRAAHGDEPLDDAARARLLDRARAFAARGLRVLTVADGPADVVPDQPHDLTVLGFLGISDPLRPAVPAAVRRCHQAGIRVIMITGDHPATAGTIARAAGILDGTGTVLTGEELSELHNGQLDARLATATVIARATPVEKLRIVESLKRQGHTVAMTGDGVNDAPALRLADVGVAMGQGGTEVARQTADVVLSDDDFASLVAALVEGRSFWRNMRRAIGLLLGGNLGEMGLLVGTAALGMGSPLLPRQILAVNMITDVLPALAVALQEPEDHDLAGLRREGASALDRALRDDVLRRGASTALPSLAAYLLARGVAGTGVAATVGFASIVATQLAQTLDAVQGAGGLARAVVGTVGTSAGLLVAALALPPLRDFLGLVPIPGLGWPLVLASAVAAVLLSRVLIWPARLAPGPAPAPRLQPAG